jgi:hypothetical protein
MRDRLNAAHWTARVTLAGWILAASNAVAMRLLPPQVLEHTRRLTPKEQRRVSREIARESRIRIEPKRK